MAIGISTAAILFFNDGEVVKEMLYPEFEAILDQVVGVSDFENMKVPAAYVRINASLKVTHVVLFLLDFDQRGYADKSWNIPLAHLADNAGKGPDLGAGPIKLSCRSQCSVSWHQRSMWDPDAHSGNTTLKNIASAAKRNRLGLTVLDDSQQQELNPAAKERAGQSNRNVAAGTSSSVAPVDIKSMEKEISDRLSKKFQEELKSRINAMYEEHKLRVATMKSEAQDHIEKLQALYRSETEKAKAALETTKHLFAEEKHKNLQLKKTQEQQANELKVVREKFQHQLQQSKEVSQESLLELEQKYELETKAKIDAVKTELKEMLDMREVELFYRDEQVGRLNAEIAELRQEKQNLLDSSGDRVLRRLVESGITFVAYQPGIDHLTVPLSDISVYLESPVDYVAGKCSVDRDRYKQWISHFELPVCSYKDPLGAICGEALPKVEKPGRFIAGESDRCAKHNRAANTLSSLMKSRSRN